MTDFFIRNTFELKLVYKYFFLSLGAVTGDGVAFDDSFQRTDYDGRNSSQNTIDNNILKLKSAMP